MKLTCLSTEQSAKTISIESAMRCLAMHHHRAAKQREQSMLSRIANQVGLSPEFAAHYWNPIQGKIGHDALDTYDRSHAAFS